MAQLFRNNAFSNLGASLTNSDTTLTVTTGHGDRFPVVAAPDFFLLTLQDASNNIEIVRVTARTAGSDSMTIQRAQEGTSARAWNIGDVVELRLTASALGPLSLLEGASTAASIRTILDVPTRTGGDASGTWNISITGNAATATTTTGNAATATKLQTARTINGTSFDGSANITTANWGTARTITIGNTGKSFDGSANVSWSLAEIGVTAATETASGIVELATAAEVQAGTDTVRAVTPAGLASRTATETMAGLIELATTAEAQALASAVVALTPARLADAFKGANQSLGSSGYQRLPGGLIIQWGNTPVLGTTPVTVTFPIAFPNACISVALTNATAAAIIVGATTFTTSSFSGWASGGGNSHLYIAIGY